MNRPRNPLLRLLGTTIRTHPISLALTLLVSGLAALTPPLVVGLTGLAVAAVAAAVATPGEEASATATRLGLALVVVAAVAPILGQVSSQLISRIQVILTRRIHLELSAKCDDLSLGQLESAEVRDAEQLATDCLHSDVAPSLTNTLALIGGLISLVTLSGLMLSWDVATALLVIFAPVPALLGQLLFSRIGWQIQVGRVDRLRYSEYIRELLSDRRWIPEVRLLDIDGPLRMTLRDHMADFTREDLRILRQRWLANLALVVVATIMTAGAYLLAILKALAMGDVGLFAGFMVGAATVQGVVQQVVGTGASLFGHWLRLGGLYAFLDLPGERHRGAALDIRTPPMIEFDNVSFSYPGGEAPVLDGLSFTIEPGEVVALVGANGSGKSTLMKLLIGAYTPTSGRVLVGGVEVRGDRALADHRCAAVFQEQVRLVGTVRDNVSGCLPFGEVEDAHVWEALREVRLDQRVAAIPGGLDAPLGREYGGFDLSVGEWQRIALARALYRQSPVLLLDEPTSAADQAASDALRRILGQVDPSRTVLMISHDAQALSMTDRWVQLSGGRARELSSGGHNTGAQASGVLEQLEGVN